MKRPRDAVGAPRAGPVCLSVLAFFLAAFSPFSSQPLRSQTPPGPEVVAHVKAGLQARSEQRYADARRELEAAVKLAPRIAEIHLNLGLVYHEQAEPELAVGALGKALALKPEVKGARMLMGFNLLALGRYGPAAEHLEKAYQEDPTPQIGYWLGLSYLNSGRPREAIPRLEEALEEQPENADLLYYAARAYSAVSAQLRLTLLRTAPDSARARQATGDDHALNGRMDQAIVEYEAALERTPQAVGIHRALGDLYREASRLDDAARHYELELRLAPGDLETNYHYGSVLLLLGRSEDALGYLRAAADGDPTHTEALFSLGKALFDQSDLGAAENAFREVLANRPTLQQAMSSHYEIARILRRRDMPEEAAEHLNLFRKLRGQLIRAEQQR